MSCPVTNFRIRQSATGTQVVHREGEADISMIDIPDANLRGVAYALIKLSDNKELMSGPDFPRLIED